VKKADNPSVVIIYGDNNKISLEGKSSHHHAVAIVLIVVVAVLAVSLCCPDLLSDFVRWLIGKAINS